MERTIRRRRPVFRPEAHRNPMQRPRYLRGHSPARCWLNRLTRIRLSDNAVVIALGTAEDDTMARLRAGEATSLVLLTATALGLASCPITEPLEVAETRAAVQADVFGEEAYPQMLLRIGWAPVNADPLPSTPRRDLSEVVTRLDGSPLG